MRPFILAIAAAFIVLSLSACHDVVLPGDGGPGGGGPGGGGRDTTDTTDPTDPRDTNYIGTIIIGGPVLDVEGMPTEAPDYAHVAIGWEDGKGSIICWGRGKFNADRTRWTAVIEDPLPEAYLYAPDAPAGALGGGVHGIATIFMTDKVYADGESMDQRSNRNGIIGQVMMYNLIYNTGREKYTPWASPWIENFPLGYSMALTAFVGWVPVKETEYPLSMVFHI